MQYIYSSYNQLTILKKIDLNKWRICFLCCFIIVDNCFLQNFIFKFMLIMSSQFYYNFTVMLSNLNCLITMISRNFPFKYCFFWMILNCENWIIPSFSWSNKYFSFWISIQSCNLKKVIQTWVSIFIILNILFI